jgi:hypothetical protein
MQRVSKKYNCRWGEAGWPGWLAGVLLPAAWPGCGGLHFIHLCFLMALALGR